MDVCQTKWQKKVLKGREKKEFAIIKTPPLNMKNRNLQLEEHYWYKIERCRCEGMFFKVVEHLAKINYLWKLKNCHH